MGTKMRKTLLATILILTAAVAVNAEDCLFTMGDDDSLDKALEAFHDIMAELVHGPVEEGNMQAVREEIGDLVNAKDAVMAANLPTKFEKHCGDISASAKTFFASVDALKQAAESNGSDEEIKEAFSKIHDSYRALRQALILPEEMIEAIHEILQPLWHEAYPAKDIEAIKAGVPKLKVRTKLLVTVAARLEDAELKAAAGNLLESITTLEEAVAADDGTAILAALELVHEAYHQLGEPEE